MCTTLCLARHLDVFVLVLLGTVFVLVDTVLVLLGTVFVLISTVFVFERHHLVVLSSCPARRPLYRCVSGVVITYSTFSCYTPLYRCVCNPVRTTLRSPLFSRALAHSLHIITTFTAAT